MCCPSPSKRCSWRTADGIQAIQGWNQEQIHKNLVQRGIKWTFNAPAGSQHRSVWERLIRSVQKVLNSMLSVHMLDEEGFRTV